MLKRIIAIFVFLVLIQPANALCFNSSENAVKKVMFSQIKYANAGDFDRFISTYDKKYVNADGFDLDVYSKLVKDVWSTYSNIKYGLKIKDISVNADEAVVKVTEYTNAALEISKNYKGELKSESDSIYYLRKTDGKWKVYSDSVVDETTSMLYGEAKNLDITLKVPNVIEPDTEYTASLEFQTPKDMVAIASITSDMVEYPQKQSKEVYRAMPEDNILERLFTSNNEKHNEYIVASIGLTQTDVCDLSIKMSLTGFGYVVKRVNVVSKPKESANEQKK